MSVSEVAIENGPVQLRPILWQGSLRETEGRRSESAENASTKARQTRSPNQIAAIHVAALSTSPGSLKTS